MSNPTPIILHLNAPIDEATVATLEGRTFQVHLITPTMLRLYPVAIPEPDTQCSVYIGGERCGRRAGHEGKHCWANGD